MAGGPVRIVWDEAKIGFIAEGLPVAAHQVALFAAAAAASESIKAQLKHSSTGHLEADVRVPTEVTPLSGIVGATKPDTMKYAGMEEQGGTIVPKNFDHLYIHGSFEGGARIPAGSPGAGQFTTRRQDIVAVVDSVQHEGKHYLEAAEAVYQPAVIQAMIDGFPR